MSFGTDSDSEEKSSLVWNNLVWIEFACLDEPSFQPRTQTHKGASVLLVGADIC